MHKHTRSHTICSATALNGKIHFVLPINPSPCSLCNLLDVKSRWELVLNRASFPMPPGRWARESSAHQTRNLVKTQTTDLLWFYRDTVSKTTDWGWAAMLTGPKQSWQWYHLWKIVFWTTIWLHFPSCKADMPKFILLLALLCFLIPTHMWHPAWRSLIIWKFEETELQRSTLNTSRNIVPPSQGQKSVQKHFEWFWVSQRESIQCKLTSPLHFRKPWACITFFRDQMHVPSHVCALSHSSCQEYSLWSVFVHCLPLLSFP